jgi:hypothetical protein
VRYFNGRSIADPRRIPEVVATELKRYSLLQARRIARLARGTIGSPLLVRRLDSEGEYYYLAPFLENRAVVGYAQVNARYGNLESIFPLKRPAKPFETDVGKIAQRLADTRIELPFEKGRFRLVKSRFTIEKTLVWRPCRQAYSPHLPFWRISSGPFTFYHRIDGPVFAQLVLNGKGI